jgi:tetratricopeptide (TPR) repeat protein
MSREIEAAIKRDDWQGARRLIRAALRQTPGSHWLLTRLGLTYYETFDYKRALTIGLQAYQLAPQCPLVLWDLAGSYDMLRRHKDVISLYRKLIRCGIESLHTTIAERDWRGLAVL